MGRREQGNNSPIHWARLTPDEQRRFTMDGKISKKDWFLNGMSAAATNNFYSKDVVNAMITKIWKKETKNYGSYPQTTAMLYDCLEQYPIHGKNVGIMGSVTPWHEAMCLAYGGIPTTIEYNKLTTDDRRLNLMTVEEYKKNPIQFDVVFSISSYEHDGLGRYGDPIDPDGDLKAMKGVRDHILKKGGHLFLGVPVGKDAVWWNAHRVYGPHRWPQLIEGFKVVYCPDDKIDEAINRELPGREYYQPAVVLENV